MISLHHQRRIRHRKGAALVEFAIVIPVILLITFLIINVNSLFYLRQSLKIAGYEGCRAGIVKGASTLNVETQVKEILDLRRVNGYSVVITPTNIASLLPGEFVTVHISVPANSNIPMGNWIATQTMETEVAMMCEK